MRHGIRTILVVGIVFVLALTAGAAQDSKVEKKVNLEVGDRAPAFEAPTDEGGTWQSSKHVGKKIIVVYFYPGDFTPGCTVQAQKFRDNMNKISALGAEVIGISGDTAMTHGLFKQAYKLNFNLLADEEGRIARLFGVPVGPGGVVKTKDADKKPLTIKRPVTTARWTFVIGLDGKIAYKNTKVEPVADSQQIEAFLEKVEKK
jgi:thioredoxin-dependent peroxiredoxin